MENSKVTLNLLRRRLKRQKRRTFLMFIIGLLLGGTIAFNVYYWYPWLKNEFSLPSINQMPTKNDKTNKKTINTTDSSIKEKQNKTEKKEEPKTISPRIDNQNYTQISPVYKDLNQKLEQTIQQYNPSGTILAIKNNQVVLLNNYGSSAKVSTDPIENTYLLASLQKIFTSLMFMKLMDEQKINLDTPLSTFYPNIPNSNNITMDQLLSMTSGLILRNKLSTSQSKEESIHYVINNVTYEPTDKWRYSDVNFFILASIIEKITNKSYEDFFDELIKKPLNLKHTGFYNDITQETHLIPSYSSNNSNEVKSEPTKIHETSYINELGTGNMYTSTTDLLTVVQAAFDGKIVNNDTFLNTLTRRNTNYSYSYKAGLYDQNDYYLGHGIFKDYEPTLLLTKDASTGVIFLSNIYYKNEKNTKLVNELCQILTQQ